MLLKIVGHIGRTSSWIKGEERSYAGIPPIWTPCKKTTTAKAGQLIHTSPLTFPDFNNHNFPISLINPRVAVVTQNTSPPLLSSPPPPG